MKELLDKIHHFFIKEGNPIVIPFFRLIYPLLILVGFGSRIQYVKREMYSEYSPIVAFQIFNIKQLGPDTLWGMYTFFLILLAFISVGFLTRITLLLACVLYFLIVGDFLSRESFELFENATSHSHNMIFYLLFTLMFLPSIDNFSINNIIFRRNKYERPYLWEESLIILVIITAYFGAGYTKLVDSGLMWIDGNSLQSYLVERKVLLGLEYPMFFINNKVNLVLLSAGTIFFECILVFGLLFRKIRWIALVVNICFHMMTLYLFNINFLETHLIFIFFFLGYLIYKIRWVGEYFQSKKVI
jgi:hypothetical protein